MKPLHRALRSPFIAAILVLAATLSAVLALRALGWMQRPEVLLFDRFLRWSAHAKEPDERIVVVGMNEDDLVKYGHPLNDELLAQLLEKIAAAGPVVIGVDLYRDLPEPRSGAGRPALDAVLLKHDTIVAIRRVPDLGPPPALEHLPERVAAGNFPRDAAIDGTVRRAYLRVRHDGESWPSLAVALSSAWLRAQGKEVASSFRPLTPDAAWYRGAQIGGEEFLLDFRGPRSFLLATVDGVLTGEVTAEDLRGRIALVGTVAGSVKDSLPTALDDSSRGILLHAQIVNQLLRATLDGQRPMNWWSEPAQIAWIALWTVLGTALGFVFRSPWRLALALGFVLAALALAAWFALHRGWWAPLATPALATVFSAAFAVSYVAFLESEERAVMRALFSRHVSRTVAETLWTRREELMEGRRLRPQRATATVLFTDLKGFTTIAEKMEPTALLDWMNEYMSAIARHVEERGGMINRFIGDAIMGVFGAPIAHTDDEGIDRDATNAVECALAMERTLIELNEGWQRRGLPTTEMRVGIFTGPLVTGSLGTAERHEYTVFGDSVNIAARLEAAGKDAAGPPSACTILIGDSTCQRLQGRYRTMLLGPMSLKGRAEKIIVHRLLGPAPSETPA